MGLYASLISADERNYLDITTLGTVEASKAITVSSAKRLIWTTTSDGSVNPISFISTMTGAGTTGGRAYFEMTTNVAMGSWANAIKAHINFGASGAVTGIASALNAELTLSAGTTEGTYAPLESELVLGAGASTGTQTSFFYCNVSGANASVFNDNGFLFALGTGVTAGAGDVFESQAKSGIAKTHTLRIKIGATTYYIALNTAVAFGGT